ncbi:hypothetical protein TcasGA2_TC005205 [Tribolium castaneum]|nr:hypothetical protein TcasGA2_TC005205 [Tribolium castaneum]
MTSKRVSPQRVRSRSKRSKTSDVLYETPGEPSPMSQVLPPLPPVVVFDMDSVIPPSPQPVYTKGDSITPDDWYDKAINQTLVDVAEKVEKNETERMERQMTNERYRLVHETVYPITKSGSKFLSVGVKPLADYALTLKIYNPEYTAEQRNMASTTPTPISRRKLAASKRPRARVKPQNQQPEANKSTTTLQRGGGAEEVPDYQNPQPSTSRQNDGFNDNELAELFSRLDESIALQNGEGGAGDGGELPQIVRNNQAVVTTPQKKR